MVVGSKPVGSKDPQTLHSHFLNLWTDMAQIWHSRVGEKHRPSLLCPWRRHTNSWSKKNALPLHFDSN